MSDTEDRSLRKEDAEAILAEHVKGGLAEVRKMTVVEKKNFIDTQNRIGRMCTPSWRILAPFIEGDPA